MSINNNIISMQSLLFKCLCEVDLIKEGNIPVVNHSPIVQSYPIVKISDVLKTKEDNYTQKIVFTISCLSDEVSSFELIRLSSSIELVFENLASLKLHTVAKNLDPSALTAISKLYACGVQSVNLHQDEEQIFNLSLKIFFVV